MKAVLAVLAVALLLFAASGCASQKKLMSISASACKGAGGKVVNTSLTGYLDCTNGKKKIGDVAGSTEKDLLICCV